MSGMTNDYEKIHDMNLNSFFKSFPDESSCRIKFIESRFEQNVICRKCGGNDMKPT